MPPYDWGIMRTPYSPRPDIAAMKGGPGPGLEPRRTIASGLDIGRQNGVDNFYRVSTRIYAVENMNNAVTFIAF